MCRLFGLKWQIAVSSNSLSVNCHSVNCIQFERKQMGWLSLHFCCCCCFFVCRYFFFEVWSYVIHHSSNMILITADEYPFKPQFCHFAKAFHAGNKTTLLIIIVVMHLINPHNRVESLGGVNLMPAYSCHAPQHNVFSLLFLCVTRANPHFQSITWILLQKIPRIWYLMRMIFGFMNS